MKRLFTFGCSFTKYKWQTWADILGLEYDEFVNYGEPGVSNQYILKSLNDFIKNNKVTSNDTIIIMWSTINRSLLYKDNKCIHKILPLNLSDDLIIEKINESLGIFKTAVQVLTKVDCKWQMLSMVNLYDSNHIITDNNRNETRVKTMFKLHKDILDMIQPSLFNIVFDLNWNSRPHTIINTKPELSIDQLLKDYNIVRGCSWPSFDDFLKDDFSKCDENIKLEVLHHFEHERNVIVNPDSTRVDFHPTPIEHLEYLIKLGFQISSLQYQTVVQWNNTLCK